MALHRLELRKLVGKSPDLGSDPIVSTDYTLEEGEYSFRITMNESGTFKFYTVSYDSAGNVGSVSSIVTVTVSSEE